MKKSTNLKVRFFCTLAFIIQVSGCSDRNAGVKDAKGDTPAKYVICGAGETNCFVGARFKDLDSCESHKKWAEMLCDSTSQSGKMICQSDEESQKIAFAYCTLQNKLTIVYEAYGTRMLFPQVLIKS